MNKNIGRIVRFDDNDYFIVSCLDVGGCVYVYLMSVSCPFRVIIGKEMVTESIIEIMEIEEEEEKRKIYNLFLEKARMSIL